MKTRFLSAAAILMLAAGSGSANTLTYYFDVFGSGIPLITPIDPALATLAAAGASASLTIPKLDQTTDPNFPNFAYALTSVGLSLEWISQGQLQLFNLTCQGLPSGTCRDVAFTDATSVVTATLHVDGVTVVADGSTSPISGTAFYGTAFPVGGGDGGPVNTYPGLSGSGTNSNAAAALSQFQDFGPSTINANVTNGVQTCTSPANLACIGNSSTGAILVVDYNFAETAIPEPVTSALTGGALLALAVFVRMKRAKRA